MGLIYCLFSTRDGIPRYVGKTTGSAMGRLRSHESEAATGANQDVYPWIRSEWLSGHDIQLHTIIDGVNSRLSFYEKQWMGKFGPLRNIRGKFYLGGWEGCEGKKVRSLCEKRAAERVDNYAGYHGITFHKADDAYTVTLTWGSIKGFCDRTSTLGDSLAGTNSERIWFADLNRAIDARERARIELMEGRRMWRTPNFKWPSDK